MTDFCKAMGRESKLRVEEKEDGLFINWVDFSPEAMRRREEARKRELLEKGDEERDRLMLQAQIERARRDAEGRGVALNEDAGEEEAARELRRQEGEKVKLSFGPPKPAPALASASDTGATSATAPQPGTTTRETGTNDDSGAESATIAISPPSTEPETAEATKSVEAAALKPVSLKIAAKPQAKNVFKNAFSGAPKKVMAAPPKKMSEAERIMKEEIERKRAREATGDQPKKKMKFQF